MVGAMVGVGGCDASKLFLQVLFGREVMILSAKCGGAFVSVRLYWGVLPRKVLKITFPEAPSNSF